MDKSIQDVPTDNIIKNSENNLASSILSEIKTRVEEQLRGKDSSKYLPYYKPQKVSIHSQEFKALIHYEELAYLNHNYHSFFNTDYVPSSERKLLGRVIIKIKRKLSNLVFSILKDYLDREREFQRNLVIHLNNISKHVDDRDTKIFWELVNKIDADVEGMNERGDRIHDLTISMFEKGRVNTLEKS